VSAADELGAGCLSDVMNSVRQAMSNVREEARVIGLGSARLRVERHWLALAAAMLVVFACFFAIGRARHSSSTPGGEPPSTLQAASVKVAIPIALGSAPPIEVNATLEAIAAANRRASAPPSAPSISIRRALQPAPSSLQAAAAGTPSSSSSEQSPSPSSSEPVQSESAPVEEAPAPSSPPAPSGAGHSGSSAGGGSFDSSG
jgi:hypothetical protein